MKKKKATTTKKKHDKEPSATHYTNSLHNTYSYDQTNTFTMVRTTHKKREDEEEEEKNANITQKSLVQAYMYIHFCVYPSVQ